MKTQTIIIKGDFTIEGDIPKNIVKKLKYLELDAIIPSNPIRIQAFSSLDKRLKTKSKPKTK